MSGRTPMDSLPRALTLPAGSTAAPNLLPALGLALLLHLGALLGIAFELPNPPPAPLPATALDILIIHEPATATPPPAPDAALSQRNHAGDSSQGDAANTELADTPAPPSILPFETIPDRRDAQPPAPERAPPDRPPPLDARPPAPDEATEIAETSPAPPPPAAEPPEPVRALLTAESPVSVSLRAPAPEPDAPRANRVNAAAILDSRADEIARLTATLETRSAAYATRARRRSVSASTREFRYASYLEAWARKIERIGNLNYPEAARDRGLHGNLILNVSVRADGSIERARIVRSSGHHLLDEAALRIVELAAPFSPFPPDIAAETDVLDIVRTWRFERGGLSSR